MSTQYYRAMQVRVNLTLPPRNLGTPHSRSQPGPYTLSPARMRLRCVLLLLILCIVAECVLSKKDAKKKKSIHDLTEHDVERIYREWEVGH